MGSKKSAADSLKINSILKDANYLITYDYDSSKEIITIKCLWDSLKNYVIKWRSGKLYSSYGDISIDCPNWAIKGLVKAILFQICQENKYPIKYVEFSKSGFVTNGPEHKNFEYLVNDIVTNGMNPSHIHLAIEGNILEEGLFPFCEIYFGLKIDKS